MKKSLFIVILMLCFGLALVSCKKNDQSESDPTATTESTQFTTTSAEEPPTDEPTGTQDITTMEPYVQNPEVNSCPYGDADQGIGSDWSENY